MSDDDFKDGDVTPGGSRIIVGKDRETGWTQPESYAENCELIQEHLEPVIGEAATVFHEIISDLVHLDVLVYAPNENRDYWVYVTSGMSDLRMAIPEGVDPAEWSRAELIMALPRAWGDALAETLERSEDDENSYWPIGLLKWLARYPHVAQTWLAPGHTIPNFENEPYTNASRLNVALVDFPRLLPASHATLMLPDGDRLNFFGLILLYPEEADFKLDQGYEALAEKFEPNGVSELLDLSRRSVIRRNPLLRLIGRT
ncbi:MAG: suppressor of fused domain protein [Pseudomonadota bacterium]